jgi:predicted ester cyclase
MATTAPSVEANKAAIRKLYDETNKGNLDFMNEILAPDFTSYGGAGFQDLHGPGEFIELTRTFLKSLPDLWFQIDELIGEGNDILVSGTLSGTHKGEWYGIPPTNKKIVWTGCAIFRFRGDQIVARWQEFDAMAIMAQMMPPAAAGAGAPA